MDTFADYMLNETDFIKKIEIVHYLQKQTNIFFDKTVIFKSYIVKNFMEQMELKEDKNLVITAMLLCACKKIIGPQSLESIKSYAKRSAEYLEKLGFDKRFCKICEEHNRYSSSESREKESDILEIADQFGGLLLDRPERIGFKSVEAIVLLEHRNLKDYNNIYLEQFKKFLDKEVITQEVSA